MSGYFHKTDDGRWYFVPENEKEFFLTCLDRFRAGWSADELKDWIEIFDTKFEKYRISGGIESVKVFIWIKEVVTPIKEILMVTEKKQ